MFIAVASEPSETQIGGVPPYTSTVVRNPAPHSASTRMSPPAARAHESHLSRRSDSGSLHKRNLAVMPTQEKSGGDANKDLSFVRVSPVITADVDDAQEQRFSNV